MLRFEWDPAKAKQNRAKHGVTFEQAALVFEDPNARFVQDRVADGEERWQALGAVAEVTILLVAHTIRLESGDEVIRIISARRATKREQYRYAQACAEDAF